MSITLSDLRLRNILIEQHELTYSSPHRLSWTTSIGLKFIEHDPALIHSALPIASSFASNHSGNGFEQADNRSETHNLPLLVGEREQEQEPSISPGITTDNLINLVILGET